MKQLENTTRIRVAIGTVGGNIIDITYHAIETDAPVDYDGFGTFTVMEWETDVDERGKRRTMRTVLINDRHLNWQTARYQSGNHGVKPSPCPDSAFIDYLWNRIVGRVP